MLRGVLSRVSPSALLVKVRLRQSVTARTRTDTSWACGTAPYEPAVTPVTGFVPESSGTGPRPRPQCGSHRVTPPAYSPLDESVEGAPGRGPTFDDRIHATGRPITAQMPQEPTARTPATLGHDLDTAVGEVGGSAHEPLLERSGPHPPAKTHTLYPAAHPRGEPDVLV